jgi:hypothetical protein
LLVVTSAPRRPGCGAHTLPLIDYLGKKVEKFELVNAVLTTVGASDETKQLAKDVLGEVTFSADGTTTRAGHAPGRVAALYEKMAEEKESEVVAILNRVHETGAVTEADLLALSTPSLPMTPRMLLQLGRLQDGSRQVAALRLARALAMEWDIANPALREEASQFKRKCYDPAVTLYAKGQVALARADGQPFDPTALEWDKIWPGSPELVPFYDRINSGGIRVTGGTERSCVEWWQAIRAEAIEREVPRIRTLVGPWKQITSHVGATLAGKDTDDEYLKLMTRHFARDPLTGQEISQERAARATGFWQGLVGGAASVSNRFSLGTRALMIAAYGPYVQGAAMAILLYLFPLAMVFLLLPGWGHYLVNYFVVFAWLRSWTVGWALADNVTDIVAASGIMATASFAENLTTFGSTGSLVASILYITTPFILAILIGGGAAALASILGFSGIGLGSFISFGTRVAGMVTGRFTR